MNVSRRRVLSTLRNDVGGGVMKTPGIRCQMSEESGDILIVGK